MRSSCPLSACAYRSCPYPLESSCRHTPARPSCWPTCSDRTRSASLAPPPKKPSRTAMGRISTLLRLVQKYRMGDTTARGLRVVHLEMTRICVDVLRPQQLHHRLHLVETDSLRHSGVRFKAGLDICFPCAGRPDAARILNWPCRTGVDDIGPRSYPLLARRRLQRQCMAHFHI